MREISGLESLVNKYSLGSGTDKKPKVKEKPETPADSVHLHQKPLEEILDEKQLKSFLKEIPKVDLHRHLEGDIRPETLLSIAQRNGLELPAKTLRGLKPYLQITPKDKTLLDFIKKFDTIGKAFSDKEAISEITYESVKECNKDNIKYAELRFSPVYMASQYGLDEEKDVIEGVLDGVEKARKDFDTDIRLIMIVERQMGPEHAAHVEQLAEKYMDRGVVGLDLANDEFNFPPGPYAKVFQQAKEAGLKITVHAGEAGGAENVRTSIEDLKADRIGHGVRTFQDPTVEQAVLDKKIPLEMCPTSNVQTGATDKLENHPLKHYYDKGILVTVNTDDPGVSDIDLSGEYYKVVTQFGFTAGDLEKILMNSVESAFLPPAEKEALKEKYSAQLSTVTEKYLMSR